MDGTELKKLFQKKMEFSNRSMTIKMKLITEEKKLVTTEAMQNARRCIGKKKVFKDRPEWPF